TRSTHDWSSDVCSSDLEAGRPSDVVNDEQIQKTVIVIIKPTSAHCPAMASNAGAGRNIRECLVAVVAIQNVSINARNKEIHVSRSEERRVGKDVDLSTV